MKLKLNSLCLILLLLRALTAKASGLDGGKPDGAELDSATGKHAPSACCYVKYWSPWDSGIDPEPCHDKAECDAKGGEFSPDPC